MLDALAPPAGGVVNTAATTKIPSQRLKRNYEEGAFRQMTTQMQGWAEQRFSRSDPRPHARYHIELGKELLAHGFTAEAETEFRHAATVDPSSPAPLTALAAVYDARGDAQQARTQAEASLRMHESVEAYVFLTRLDLREDRTDSAAHNINRALQMEPSNATAKDLKRTLAAKLAEKAQPLQKP
jgi:Tfp pilus assembly protein PilF